MEFQRNFEDVANLNRGSEGSLCWQCKDFNADKLAAWLAALESRPPLTLAATLLKFPSIASVARIAALHKLQMRNEYYLSFRRRILVT